MKIKSRYLDNKTSKASIRVNILDEIYYIKTFYLPCVICRIYGTNNELYAFIWVGKNGKVMIRPPADIMNDARIVGGFYNVLSMNDAITGADIVDLVLNANGDVELPKVKHGTSKSVKSVLDTDKLNALNKQKINVTDVHQDELVKESVYSYSDETEDGVKLGYKRSFKTVAKVPESVYSYILDRYEAVKKICDNTRCSVNFTELGREYDEKTGKAYMRFEVEGRIETVEWQVLALLYFPDEKPIVKPLVEIDKPLLQKLYNLKCNCDYCNKKTKKIKTFYIRNLKNGRCLQIAKGCLDNYIGIKEINVALEFEKFLNCLKDEDELEKQTRSARSYNLKDLLAEIVKNYGATKEKILQRYDEDMTSLKGEWIYDTLTADEKQFISDMIDWIYKQDASIDVVRNAQVLLKTEIIRSAFFGELQAIVTRYKAYLNLINNKLDRYVSRVEFEKKYAEDILETYKANIEKWKQDNMKYDKEIAEKTEYFNGLADKIEADFHDNYAARIAAQDTKLKEENMRKLKIREELKTIDDDSSLSAYDKALLSGKLINNNLDLFDKDSWYNFYYDTKISVLVKSVYVEKLHENKYDSKETAGPYEFTTVEGYKLVWYIATPIFNTLGLGEIEEGKLYEFEPRRMECRTRYAAYGKRGVTYCKFVDGCIYTKLLKPEALEIKDTDDAALPLLEYNYDSYSTLSRSEFIKKFVVSEFSYTDIENKKNEAIFAKLVLANLKDFDPEKYYREKFSDVHISYSSFLRRFRNVETEQALYKSHYNSEEVENRREFVVTTGIMIRVLKNNEFVVFSIDKGYVVLKLADCFTVNSLADNRLKKLTNTSKINARCGFLANLYGIKFNYANRLKIKVRDGVDCKVKINAMGDLCYSFDIKSIDRDVEIISENNKIIF